MLRLLRFGGCRGYRTHAGVFGHIPAVEKVVSLPREVHDVRATYSNLFRLITAFRENGHILAATNPVSFDSKPEVPELEPNLYNLNMNDVVRTSGLVVMPQDEATVAEVIAFLKSTYCGTLTADLSYLPEHKKEWIASHLEATLRETPEPGIRKYIARILVKSQMFDLFLNTKFPTLKRYGLEGGESMLAFFLEILERNRGVDNFVIGMPHRGRLNLLTGLLNMPPSILFRKIRGGEEMTVDSRLWIGDVLSHVTCSEDIGNVHVTMLPNPSHLELVNPVSMGKTRGKQMAFKEVGYGDGRKRGSVLNVQVHGDAAFAGQGVNQETLAMSNVPHFTVGGSIHLVVNNQLGFTTPGDRGRSSRYSSDLAKTNLIPIIHVNGDNPEAVLKAAKIALKYQREMKEDIFVEMHCYRRRGHNELDDPTFTSPLLYKTITNTKTTPDAYKDQLVKEGLISEKEVADWEEDYSAFLNSEFRKETLPSKTQLQKQWSGIQHAGANLTKWETGLGVDTLRYIGQRSVSYPDTFSIHPHLEKMHVQPRLSAMGSPENARLDWSTAEALAFGSLLLQGFNVRISGQDVGRGTFSQRHAMLVDQQSNDTYIPLNDLAVPEQAHLEVANSILSEEAVLCFEYGLSIESPQTLVIWEAQFGDFMNGAQAVIDTHVASGEAKWGRCSSLTMLLPHGYDGAGPEHSSCRIERFLQLTNSSEISVDADDVNMYVVSPTTPAQYFHLLRRQQIRNFRSPLVVVAPKTLLRLSAATSRFEEFGPDTQFLNVLTDSNPKAKKMVFTTGKHYYNLSQSKPGDAVLVRLESLCPFPAGELQQVVAAHPHVTDFVWSQEEPMNMGAWSFVAPRFENLVGVRPRYVGRPTISAPAYGLSFLHKSSQEECVSKTFS